MLRAAGRAIGEERVARHLHGDGGETFAETQRHRVANDGAANADPVESLVLVEAPIFSRDERAPHVDRHRGQRHVDASHGIHPPHGLSVPVQQSPALRRLVRDDLSPARTAVEAAREQPRVEEAP